MIGGAPAARWPRQRRAPRAKVSAASTPMSAHRGQGMTLTVRSAVRATGEPSVVRRARGRRDARAGTWRVPVEAVDAVDAAAAAVPPRAGVKAAAADPP